MKTKFIEKSIVNYNAIFSFIWKKRKRILICLLLGFIFGLVSAKLSNKIYKSSTTVVPNKNKTQNFGGLSSLASLAGVNVGGMDGNDISPDLYNEVLKSYSFNHKILNTKMHFSQSDSTATIIEYFENIYQLDVFDKMKKLRVRLTSVFGDNKSEKSSNKIKKTVTGIYRYSGIEEKYRLKLQELIQLQVDDIKGNLSINVEFPDKLGAASIAKAVTKILQDFVISVKINKAKDNYDFLLKRYQEEKSKFQKVQEELAKFEDSNSNAVSALVSQKRQAIRVKYELRNQVFSEVAKQLETSRMTLQKDTPVFTVVKDVVIPTQHMKPSTITSIIKWGVLFAFLFVSFSLGFKFRTDLKSK